MHTLAPRTVAPFRPAAAFEVLNHPTRKLILERLRSGGPANTIQLADDLGLSTLKLTHHLTLLREAGLIRLRSAEQGQIATFSPIGWGRLKRSWQSGLRNSVGLAVVR